MKTTDKDTVKTAKLTIKLLTNLFQKEFTLQELICKNNEEESYQHLVSVGKVIAYTEAINLIRNKFNILEDE